MDTSASQASSIHNRREIHEAVCGELSHPIAMYPYQPISARWPQPSTSTSLIGCVRSETTVWWTGAFATQGFKSLSGCRNIQPSSGAASGVHSAGAVPGCKYLPQSVYESATAVSATTAPAVHSILRQSNGTTCGRIPTNAAICHCTSSRRTSVVASKLCGTAE